MLRLAGQVDLMNLVNPELDDVSENFMTSQKNDLLSKRYPSKNRYLWVLFVAKLVYLQIKRWVSNWDLSIPKYQQLLKVLYEALDNTKQR